jgi:TraG P-loop domain
VWSLRQLADELKPAAMLLVLDAIWATVTHPHDRRRRLITVDEAWLLLAHPGGAQFLLRAAKAGRKHWAGLTVITQDTADVLSTDLGRAVIANAATQILLRQAPQALDHVASTFGLSAGERGFLQSAERGEGLLTCGQHRAAFGATASALEDQLVTTDPRQLAAATDNGPEWIDLDNPTRATRPGRPTPRQPVVTTAGADDDTQEIW